MLSRYWKAIIAFVAIAGTAVGSAAVDPDITGVLPTGASGAVTAAGLAIGTALVWLKRNAQTVEDLDAAAERLGFKLTPITVPPTELP